MRYKTLSRLKKLYSSFRPTVFDRNPATALLDPTVKSKTSSTFLNAVLNWQPEDEEVRSKDALELEGNQIRRIRDLVMLQGKTMKLAIAEEFHVEVDALNGWEKKFHKHHRLFNASRRLFSNYGISPYLARSTVSALDRALALPIAKRKSTKLKLFKRSA